MFEFNLRSAHSLFSTITIEKLIAFEIRDNSLAYILPEFNVDPGWKITIWLRLNSSHQELVLIVFEGLVLSTY